jgi:fructose-specific phosphotransferase system component IIB
MSNKKQKLQMEIERNVQFLVSERIKNHVQDATILYIRRNKIQVDGESMVKVLDAVNVAIDDAYLQNVDELMNKINATLEAFEEEVSNPLSDTGKTKQD